MAPTTYVDGGYEPCTSDSRVWDQVDRYHASVPGSNNRRNKVISTIPSKLEEGGDDIAISLWSMWGLDLGTIIAGVDMRDEPQ
jgi:hypothetical protein